MHVCRRLLEQRLTLNAELRTHFVTGLREQLGDAAVLHAALKPMAVTGVSPVACLAVPACLPKGVAELRHSTPRAGHSIFAWPCVALWCRL